MAITVKKTFADRLVREIIRMCDARREEYEFIKNKYPDSYQHLDLEARNVFPKVCSSAMLKCVYSFNIYGTRDKK